jgi:hypothetical protein
MLDVVERLTNGLTTFPLKFWSLLELVANTPVISQGMGCERKKDCINF